MAALTASSSMPVSWWWLELQPPPPPATLHHHSCTTAQRRPPQPPPHNTNTSNNPITSTYSNTASLASNSNNNTASASRTTVYSCCTTASAALMSLHPIAVQCHRNNSKMSTRVPTITLVPIPIRACCWGLSIVLQWIKQQCNNCWHLRYSHSNNRYMSRLLQQLLPSSSISMSPLPLRRSLLKAVPCRAVRTSRSAVRPCLRV